jgi:hypothetical protein
LERRAGPIFSRTDSSEENRQIQFRGFSRKNQNAGYSAAEEGGLGEVFREGKVSLLLILERRVVAGIFQGKVNEVLT